MSAALVAALPLAVAIGIRRDAIKAYERHLLAHPNNVPAASCPVRHHFAPGQYAREMFLPAGLDVVGKVHKHAHVNVISQGHVEVFTPNEGLMEYKAPVTFVSSPHTKRVVRVLEDTVWTTFHATDKTDLAEIERDIIEQEEA